MVDMVLSPREVLCEPANEFQHASEHVRLAVFFSSSCPFLIVVLQNKCINLKKGGLFTYSREYFHTAVAYFLPYP